MHTSSAQHINTSLETRRQAVGTKLQRRQILLEEAIQHALEQAAEFSADLARAPAEANLSRTYGQATVARAAQVISLLSEARGACASAHAGLERARKDLGVNLMWPFDDHTESTPPDKDPNASGADIVKLADAAAA